MSWQPIETAPKDGTEVLGFDGVDRRVIVWEVSIIFGANWFIPTTSGGGQLYWKPTHWTPLPAPPST